MSDPIRQDDALFDFAKKLEAAGIDYMLTGSLALSFYAEPRATNGIDVVLSADESHLEVILGMFPLELNWYWSEAAAKDAAERKSMFNVVHSLSGLKFDLVFLKPSEFEQKKFERRMRFESDGKSLWVIRPEDLLLSKLAWSLSSESAMQAKDIRTLLRDVPELDWEYVNSWIDRIGAREWFERIRSS